MKSKGKPPTINQKCARLYWIPVNALKEKEGRYFAGLRIYKELTHDGRTFHMRLGKELAALDDALASMSLSEREATLRKHEAIVLSSGDEA